MALMQIAEPGQSPDPHKKSIVIGIDLGTTHSLVAAVKNGIPVCLVDEHDNALVDSLVHYADQSITVGRVLNQSNNTADPEGDKVVSIASIKRFIGRSSQEVQALLQQFPVSYEWDFSDKALPKINTPVGLKTPVEISSEILKALKCRVIQHFNIDQLNEYQTDAFQAVITVPAYFDDAQRQATHDAARLAGIQVLRLINEPTAAALAYGVQEEGTSIVYDFGGGTFDASLISKQNDVFEVVSTAGNTFLGGDDIDQALVDYVLAEDSNVDQNGLRLELRQAKELLSQQSVVHVRGVTITESILKLVMEPIIARTVVSLQQVLVDADLAWSDISQLLLVGGSTRSPLLMNALERLTSLVPRNDVNPDEVVALGALAQARKMTSADVQHLLLDVCPLSLGLETMGGIVEKIIPRNTPIPVTKKQIFTTMKNNQSALLLHIVQGERESVEFCRSLAKFELRGLPQQPAGVARIEVQFAIDANGVLSVSAEELSTATQTSVDITPSQGLTEEQMLQLLQESNVNAQVDIKQRMLVSAKVELERIIQASDAAFDEDRALLNAQETNNFNTVLMKAREIAADESASRESYIEMRERLNKASETLAARRMDRAIKLALEGTYIT